LERSIDMNTIIRNLTLALSVTLLGVSSLRADELCWTGFEDTRWELPANWDLCGGGTGHVPTGNDTAIIKGNADKDCYVNDNRIVAVLKVESGIRHLRIGNDSAGGQTLTVNDHAEIDGLVRITNSATLELAGTTTTTVDGVVVFWLDIADFGGSDPCDGDPFGTLLVSENTTIEGDGGLIVGRECTQDEAPTRGVIRTATGKRVTLKTAASGEPLLVVGCLDIQARLTNDSARVGTNEDTDVLWLSKEDKDGDNGRWFCEEGEFHVKGGAVAVKVTGSNTWDMTEADAEATLFFESGCDCTCLSGDFEVKNGVVDLDEDICTTGSATLKSTNGSQPTIYAHFGANGTIAGNCTTLCGS
jgi:hypothetical protein